jgi:tetratricopeptide (TPR) repeat protein
MSRTSRVLQMHSAPVRKPSFAEDPRLKEVVQQYETGLRLMQERKFERAKAALLKVAQGPSKELAERVSVHLSTCNQALARTSTTFKSAEEHYDYAISLMNAGDYEDAREHLEKMAKQNAKADYIWYGLATLASLESKPEECIRHLSEAIRLNSSNRFQARNDSDFQNMFDDPRFTELLYPEPGEAATPAPGGRGDRSR